MFLATGVMPVMALRWVYTSLADKVGGRQEVKISHIIQSTTNGMEPAAGQD